MAAMMTLKSCRLLSSFFVVYLLQAGRQVEALGCFRCTSVNHSNPDCEDTFNSNQKFWVGDCWALRKGRSGEFPGTQCVKMIAEDEDTGFSMVMRNCVVDNGGTNSETEIGRLTHCGWLRTIVYDGKRMRGCILACDTDGCNMAALPPAMNDHFLLVLTSVMLSAIVTAVVSGMRTAK